MSNLNPNITLFTVSENQKNDINIFPTLINFFSYLFFFLINKFRIKFSSKKEDYIYYFEAFNKNILNIFEYPLNLLKYQRSKILTKSVSSRIKKKIHG